MAYIDELDEHSLPSLLASVDLGKMLFDRVLEMGVHLFGQSWSIEQLGLWGKLKIMFEYVPRCREFSTCLTQTC